VKPRDERQLTSRIVVATAPIRICDNGGWTDTWVAQHGKVFNIAVEPRVEVRIDAFPQGSRESRTIINATNYGVRYTVSAEDVAWGPHPLLEAALRAIPPPDHFDVEVTVQSQAPAGASTGTSAAVLVALLGALDRLAGGRRTPADIAREAHDVETRRLGRQCGVQDQLCSAFGGVNFIDVVAYPRAVVSPIAVGDDTLIELNRRLALIYLGRPHSSSTVHERVIRDLERLGPDCAPLNRLRAAAERARDAMLVADFNALGAAMCENTNAQAELHSDLVDPDAWRVTAIAAAHGAAGWKVNGAGGDGGSITLLCDPREAVKRAMLQAIAQENAAFVAVPVAVSADGLRIELAG
jgi:D-glycero-alpha-D-manno-heptose-7-phosphate kinase